MKPHDLRRTYARNAYDFGMDLERIRQNLGAYQPGHDADLYRRA